MTSMSQLWSGPSNIRLQLWEIEIIAAHMQNHTSQFLKSGAIISITLCSRRTYEPDEQVSAASSVRLCITSICMIALLSSTFPFVKLPVSAFRCHHSSINSSSTRAMANYSKHSVDSTVYRSCGIFQRQPCASKPDATKCVSLLN